MSYDGIDIYLVKRQPIGIVLNLALTTTVTNRIPTVLVKEIIETCENFNFIDDIPLKDQNNFSKIFINGILTGICEDPQIFLDEMRFYRKTGLLDKQISFIYNKLDNEIKIFSDEGRLIRPVFTVNEHNQLNISESDDIDWYKFVDNGYIEYIDNNEAENSVIAMDQTDLKKFKCNYCEICPAMMMGVMSNNIPFPDHSQCIFKDEPVYLADGTTKPICDVQIGDKVITFDPTNQKQSITTVTYTETHPTNKEMFQITTISGRKITATYDHRFMTNNGWKRLEELKVNNTLIAISIEPKPVSTIVKEYIIMEQDTFINNCLKSGIKNVNIQKYCNEIKHLLPLKNTSKYINIISRLFGFLLTNTWIGVSSKYGNTRLSANFGSEYSLEIFESDIKYLGFRTTKGGNAEKIGYGSEHSGAFPAFFIALGMIYGKKTTQYACKIPDWIMNGSDMIKREFLAGFQGGDGSKIKSGSDKQINIHIGATTKTIQNKYVNSMIKMMSDIVKLFRELGIDINDIKYKPSTKYEDRIEVSYYISSTRENLIKYFDTINYRYDVLKQLESGKFIEYLKYIELEYKNRVKLVEKIKSYGNISRSEIAQKLGIPIKIVCDILKLNGKEIGLPNGLITVKQWCNSIKFESNTLFVPIRSIIKSNENIISDITVDSKNQSFLCGDAYCVHNSPRNIYQSSMGKQSVGMFALSHQIRTDTIVHVLDYPQKAIVSTIPSKFMGFDDMPSGINAIVAIMCYSGFNIIGPYL